jgi:hypothetical protein
VEVSRRDVRLFAYRNKIADNKAHIAVNGDC